MTFTRLHLVGIGGIGMSAIARLLLSRGVGVSGSDLKDSILLRDLRACGARIFIGHRGGQLGDAEAVVYSTAVSPDNPEVREAKERGIPLLRRAEALALLMEDKKVVAVTGSHGKTTTTSLLAGLLLEAGVQPSVAVGGIVRLLDTNACAGEGEYFVAEADESDGSFLFYRPFYSVVTNIDREHLDHHKDFDTLVAAFSSFIGQTRDGGCVFVSQDDVSLREIAAAYRGTCVSFGLTPQAQVYPRNVSFRGLSASFDCFREQEPLGRFDLALGGMHNVSNALAVIAVGTQMRLPLQVIRSALAGYRGAGRRIEVKYQGDWLIIDDYAHHPTEIRATLRAVANLQSRRLVAVFQPHRYTRTRLLLDEFATCFQDADTVIITDLYAASEQPVPGISAQALVQRIRQLDPRRPAEYVAKAGLVEELKGRVQPGDCVVFLGAGDISRVCDELVQTYTREPAA